MDVNELLNFNDSDLAGTGPRLLSSPLLPASFPLHASSPRMPRALPSTAPPTARPTALSTIRTCHTPHATRHARTIGSLHSPLRITAHPSCSLPPHAAARTARDAHNHARARTGNGATHSHLATHTHKQLIRHPHIRIIHPDDPPHACTTRCSPPSHMPLPLTSTHMAAPSRTPHDTRRTHTHTDTVPESVHPTRAPVLLCCFFSLL